MRCEICQDREATLHVTFVVGGQPGSEMRRDLCEDCARHNEELATGLSPKTNLKDECCVYCGAPSAYGVPDLLAAVEGTRHSRYLCERCAKENVRFMRQQLPSLASGAVSPAEMKTFPLVLARVDKHMKNWMNKGPDNAPKV